MKAYLLGTLAAVMAIAPMAASAQMFAYVNQAGEVSTVDAANANTALMTAPSIDEHSGVLLLDSTADSQVVGETVPVK